MKLYCRIVYTRWLLKTTSRFKLNITKIKNSDIQLIYKHEMIQNIIIINFKESTINDSTKIKPNRYIEQRKTAVSIVKVNYGKITQIT